ncbi:hypothetical protein [Pseudonocardia sp. ICBG162]|uniref:hypothetical protein n=1 Tax=Pseudonocardia sp. ICBG162 TaxID=2846761 RepID=UPI001CF6DAD9|nr:hypothetical protein [Pseudonocardia sp. ICBG162]
MVAKRDQLDRDQHRQRELEESAFDRYARAQLMVTAIEQERDELVAELDQRREQAMASARERVDAVASEQCTVLHELHVDGRGRRSAEELASLFDLPVKRVRSMLKRARSTPLPGAAPQAPVTSGAQGDAPCADDELMPGPVREQSGDDRLATGHTSEATTTGTDATSGSPVS